MKKISQSKNILSAVYTQPYSYHTELGLVLSSGFPLVGLGGVEPGLGTCPLRSSGLAGSCRPLPGLTPSVGT